MKLPTDYLQVVERGATVLHAFGARLREAATRQPETPELWLSVRDFQGFAGRLAESTDWEWRQGFAGLTISPQDLAVVDELLALGHAGTVQLSVKERAILIDLRAFLRQYCERESEPDDGRPLER